MNFVIPILETWSPETNKTNSINRFIVKWHGTWRTQLNEVACASIKKFLSERTLRAKHGWSTFFNPLNLFQVYFSTWEAAHKIYLSFSVCTMQARKHTYSEVHVICPFLILLRFLNFGNYLLKTWFFF